MLVQAAETSFKQGLHALSRGCLLEATALFEAALVVERQGQVDRPQARYLSYYGLCVGLSGRLPEGVKLCRKATQLEEFDPNLYWNLTRVLLEAGRRREAFKALHLGLHLQPTHRQLRALRRQMGKRRRPPLPFLARAHPINVALGRLRNSV